MQCAIDAFDVIFQNGSTDEPPSKAKLDAAMHAFKSMHPHKIELKDTLQQDQAVISLAQANMKDCLQACENTNEHKTSMGYKWDTCAWPGVCFGKIRTHPRTIGEYCGRTKPRAIFVGQTKLCLQDDLVKNKELNSAPFFNRVNELSLIHI